MIFFHLLQLLLCLGSPVTMSPFCGNQDIVKNVVGQGLNLKNGGVNVMNLGI
jgi:hypothetical protein